MPKIAKPRAGSTPGIRPGDPDRATFCFTRCDVLRDGAAADGGTHPSWCTGRIKYRCMGGDEVMI